MKLRTKLALSAAALLACTVAAFAYGPFSSYPLVGEAANTTCLSFGNNGVCNQFRPAGPAALVGTEIIPADTQYASQNPVTIAIPVASLSGGVGIPQLLTTDGTGQNIAVPDGVNLLIYNGTATGATYATLGLPPNPFTGQRFCVANAGAGVLTITAAGLLGTANVRGLTASIVGAKPATIPVQVTSGAAGTYVQGNNCWVFVASATPTTNGGSWYRVQ